MFDFGKNFEMPSDLNGEEGLPPSAGGLPQWAAETGSDEEAADPAPVQDNQRFLSVGLRFFEKIKDIS